MWPDIQGLAPVMELVIPKPTPSNNEIKGMHPQVYKKRRRELQALVRAALPADMPEAVTRAFLVVDRYCSGRGLDWDNAYGGLKPLLDCLVCPSDRNPDGLGVIEDDNPQVMPYPPLVGQHKAKAGEGMTVVKVYALP